MTKQEVDRKIISMLRIVADAKLNETTTDEQFLAAMWFYQKSGAILNEKTLLRDVIRSMVKN
jgi:hypothetical protein